MEDGRAVIRILLADEQSLFREAVRVVLESQPDLSVVAEAQTGCQGVEEVERTSPDIALLSASLPDCDGVRTAHLICERTDACRVLVLGQQEDQRTLLEALEAGASGYLTKDRPLSELIHAVRAISRGETIVPPWMLGGLLGALIRRRRQQNVALERIYSLTRREREVLRLLVEGVDHGAIARELVISPETARTHIQNVLRKLDVHSRLEAAAFVRENDVEGDLVGADD